MRGPATAGVVVLPGSASPAGSSAELPRPAAALPARPGGWGLRSGGGAAEGPARPGPAAAGLRVRAQGAAPRRGCVENSSQMTIDVMELSFTFGTSPDGSGQCVHLNACVCLQLYKHRETFFSSPLYRATKKRCLLGRMYLCNGIWFCLPFLS